MNKIILLSLIIGLIAVSCTDPNTIGLEIQPTSDNIIISSADFDGLTSEAESEDSVRTDKALRAKDEPIVILGEIKNDPVFDNNSSSFLTQVLLTENNTDLGANPEVDSVVLSYDYYDYYGDLLDFDDLIITKLNQSLDINTHYYSNFSYSPAAEDLVSSFMLNKDSLTTPILKVNLGTTFAQDLFNLGNEPFVDNETFLTHFSGFFVSATAENTILYLNPNGSNSYFKIYYHNDESDSLSLDFELGSDAVTRFSLFNKKNDENIIIDDSRIYMQSMAGYKVKISINNIDSLKALLDQKAINKVTMSFDVEAGSQSEYAAHDQLFLSRVKEDGTYMKIFQPSDMGINVFLAALSESNKYKFNITSYFYQLLNNDSYTNELYLFPSGAAVNANRTIIEKDIKLTIHYSQL